MKYDIELVDRHAERRPVGTAFSNLGDAARFALKLASELRDPDSPQSLRFGNAGQVVVRRANVTEMAITVLRN
jgi:hypothetical protein